MHIIYHRLINLGMLIEWVSITCIRKKYNTCEISRVCNNPFYCSKEKHDHAWLCLTYFDFEFGDGFNRNFFDRDRRFYYKNWIFRIIEIRKIGNIFTLKDSKKDWDWQSDSKNLVVSKNRRSNHRGLTILWFPLEPPHWGVSREIPEQIMCFYGGTRKTLSRKFAYLEHW